MPVEILTPQQRRRYGHFEGSPTPEQVAKYCFLTPSELKIVTARRPGEWQQMGYAVQLMTVRFLGTFLGMHEALNVPRIIFDFAARQLGILSVPDMGHYRHTIDIARSHRDSIRTRFGYTEFASAEAALKEWLQARVLRADDTRWNCSTCRPHGVLSGRSCCRGRQHWSG